MADTKGTTTTNGMKVDTKLIRQLADMLTDTGLTEIEVEDGDRKIRVARHASPSGQAMAYAPAPAAAAPAVPAPAAAAPAAEPAAVAANAIRSPMVGTAYLSSEPGADAF